MHAKFSKKTNQFGTVVSLRAERVRHDPAVILRYLNVASSSVAAPPLFWAAPAPGSDQKKIGSGSGTLASSRLPEIIGLYRAVLREMDFRQGWKYDGITKDTGSYENKKQNTFKQ